MSGRDQLRIQAVRASAQASLVAESELLPPQTPPRTLSNSIRTSTTDTPMTGSSQGPETGFEKVADVGPIILAELAGHDCKTDRKHFDKLFVGKVASTKDINSFLRKTKLYSNAKKRWTGIPETPKLEKDLYKPMFDIFKAILVHFKYSATRTVIDSHKFGLEHVEGAQGLNSSSTPLKSSPDIIIKGTGPIIGPDSTAVDSKRKKGNKTATKKDFPQYRSCVTPVEIKTEANRRYSENFAQIGVYVRQCFIQQKNRHFVYSLIVTENNIQLFHFDRSGSFHTIRVNIHDEPAATVRIVLGISSTNDRAVGFDTSVFWEGDTRYIKTLDENKSEIKYPLSKPATSFSRRAIRGRGTICWKGYDKQGRLVIIKDAWRSRDRTPEWELLEKVRGLEGVGQMVAWEEDDLTTSKLRGFDLEKLSTFLDFRDRIFSRITLEAYGKSIDYFQSREEFLYAFRDAVAGHKNLWNSGILHRDISVNNILIGQPNAEPGNRGVVVDLDMAIRIDRTDTLATVDFRTGTRAFQSISVLSSVNKAAGQALSHDHLDDLESFFYVFCWITLGYDGPNKPIIDNRRPDILKQWDQDNAVAAANSKTAMLAHLREKVTPYFGPIFQKLLINMHAFYWPHIILKMEQMDDATIPRKHLLDLTEPAKADYATLLDFIDQTITALESDNAQCATSAQAPTPATPTRNNQPPDLAHSGSSLKRRADDPGMIDSSPKSKKQKQKRHSRSFSLPTVEQ